MGSGGMEYPTFFTGYAPSLVSLALRPRPSGRGRHDPRIRTRVLVRNGRLQRIRGVVAGRRDQHRFRVSRDAARLRPALGAVARGHRLRHVLLGARRLHLNPQPRPDPAVRLGLLLRQLLRHELLSEDGALPRAASRRPRCRDLRQGAEGVLSGVVLPASLDLRFLRRLPESLRPRPLVLPLESRRGDGAAGLERRLREDRGRSEGRRRLRPRRAGASRTRRDARCFRRKRRSGPPEAKKTFESVVVFGNRGEWPHGALARLVFEDGTVVERALPAEARWVRLRIRYKSKLAWAAADPERVNAWEWDRSNDSIVLGRGKGRGGDGRRASGREIFRGGRVSRSACSSRPPGHWHDGGWDEAHLAAGFSAVRPGEGTHPDSDSPSRRSSCPCWPRRRSARPSASRSPEHSRETTSSGTIRPSPRRTSSTSSARRRRRRRACAPRRTGRPSS